MALLALFCIGLTYSRGGWLALGFVAVGLMILGLGRLRPMLRLGLGGGVVSLLLLVITFIPSIQVRLSSIFSGRNDSSNNFRITVWETVRQMIQDHFWLGIGPGNKTFEAIYPYYQRAGFNALGAYSVPLETWVEVGFIGLIVWLWMLVTIAVWGVGLWFTLPPRQAWWCAAALLLVVGLLVQGLFDTVWYRPQVQTLWWFGVAIINSYAVANMGKPTPE